jgi:hypothetical protein
MAARARKRKLKAITTRKGKDNSRRISNKITIALMMRAFFERDIINPFNVLVDSN